MPRQSPRPEIALATVVVSSRTGGCTYLDVRQAVPLHGCDASTFVELDLPNAAEVGQKVLDKLASLDIPHLEGPV